MGDQPLNTEVVGDSESCRANASWLTALSDGVGDLGAAFARTGSESESFWRGAASDAFRGSMANAKSNASQVEHVASDTARALTRFADELDTVTSRMTQARQVASEAGLVVTDKEILPPDAGPGAAPQAPSGAMSPQQEQRYAALVGQYNAELVAPRSKVAAFDEVTGTVSDARGKERAAHDALLSATKQHSETLDTLRTYGAIALSKSVALVGGLAGASQKLLESSERSRLLATLATALRASPTLPAGADGWLKSAQAELFEKVYKDGFDRAGIEKIIGRIPPNVRQVLNWNFSDLTKWISGIDKGTPSAFQTRLPILKRLPLVGTALTAGTAAFEMNQGGDKLKIAENAVGGTAAAIGVSAGVESLVGSAAVAGMAVPGPGWVVAGTLVLGTAAAYGVGYVVDHYGDQINHSIGSTVGGAAQAVADATRGVGHLF